MCSFDSQTGNLSRKMKATTIEIIDILKEYGKLEYGEGISVLSHSMQSGAIALSQDLEDELILAAFLHDIGHLSPLVGGGEYEHMGNFGITDHEEYGAHFLEAKYFSDRIISCVKNHVQAKRYLCFQEKDYHVALSEASRRTLQYQGGPMSVDEAHIFESDPYFKDAITIRRIDEMAKEKNFEIDDNHWNLLILLLENHNH